MSAEALDAIKSLVRLLLERERLQLAGLPSVGATADLKLLLKTIPTEDLLATIQRQRLVSLMQGDAIAGELLPELQPKLNALGRMETMAALALASLTREMAALFEQAGTPMLVIKGIPLALQTTGSITSRGRGDLDLFVDPNRLGEAIELLQSEGFAQSYGHTLHGEKTRLGHYSRFVDMELSMHRHRKIGTQWIDLHWHVSHARGMLPGFNELWAMRESVFIGNQEVHSLALSESFLHACCHAANDRWMCLRNLIDVERLSRMHGEESLLDLGRKRLVRKTCLIAYDLTTSPSLKIIAAQLDRRKAFPVLAIARKHQLLPWRSLGSEGWTIKSRAKISLYRLGLSHYCSNLISVILGDVMPPSILIDSQTGQRRSPLQLFQSRFFKLAARVIGHDSSQATLSQTRSGSKTENEIA